MVEMVEKGQLEKTATEKPLVLVVAGLRDGFMCTKQTDFFCLQANGTEFSVVKYS